jgi:glutamine synthetase
MEAHRSSTTDDLALLRVAERVETGRIDLVRFLYADHDGIIRGKSVAGRRISSRIRSGIPEPTGMMAMSMLDALQPVEGMGPVGEVRIVPDPATYTPLPYAPGAAVMLSDLVRPDGRPWDACPRAFLTSAVAALADEGCSLLAAYEPEFTLGHRVPVEGGPDRLEPVDDSLCHSGTGFQTAHDYVIELVRALESQGMQVEHCYPGLGPGQQTVSIRPADPVRAADNHLLYRETARAVARRQGLWASLAPKPISDNPGNGAHLRLSLWRENRNAFHVRDADDTVDVVDVDARAPGGCGADRLPDTGRWFIGGLLAHLPALAALTAGSVNGFRRLVPGSWAGVHACYGLDNREAAIRLSSPMLDDPENTAGIELRPSDSSANPYLALGAVIHAGLDGIRRRTEPGEAVQADPATLSEGLRPPRLPATLGEALAALQADDLLMDALGPLRSTAYLAVKRSDVEAFAGQDADQEYFRHFTTF